MNIKENLLTTLIEEAAEIIHHTSKGLRFGLEDGYPGSSTSNYEDIITELEQLISVYEMLVDENILPKLKIEEKMKIREDKKEKVKHYRKYSRAKGTLT